MRVDAGEWGVGSPGVLETGPRVVRCPGRTRPSSAGSGNACSGTRSETYIQHILNTKIIHIIIIGPSHIDIL